jgi:hypothetical protein
MSFALRSRSRQPQDLLVDVAVHFVKARGATGVKVFKVGRFVLPPAGKRALRAVFSLAVHTTRVPRAGRHAVDVVVNGRRTRAGSFRVTAARRPGTGPSRTRAAGVLDSRHGR